MSAALTTSKKNATPITPLSEDGLALWLKDATPAHKAWVKARHFTAKSGEGCILPNPDGGFERVLFGLGPDMSEGDLWTWASLRTKLPKGNYWIDADLGADMASNAALGWALDAYKFERFKKGKAGATLVWPKGAKRSETNNLIESISLSRDLINTPASHLGPVELAAAARKVAKTHSAKFTVISGEQLVKKNFPAIYAVGKGAPTNRAPRLINMTWGRAKAPKLTLVGKGVCFDTGGINLKPTMGLKLMKKDMGGAALVLGLASMIMAQKLDVRLRVLIPAVENSISGEAMRPSDVIESRKGLTIEIGNTDAEGRVILADALFEAAKEKPDLIMDWATLTGAARVALGAEVPVLFSSCDDVAEGLTKAASQVRDPLWRLPLWQDYRKQMESRIADIRNDTDSGYGGAITAALFLETFVGEDQAWTHVDLMGYNTAHKAGRPIGGEAQTLRGAYSYLSERYGK